MGVLLAKQAHGQFCCCLGGWLPLSFMYRWCESFCCESARHKPPCCPLGGVVALQALEAARKQLQKREAELAEAMAEAEAAAGEREQIKEQVAASEASIQGT